MPANLIVGALGGEAVLGAFGASLVTLGVRVAETYALNAILNQSPDQPTSGSGTSGGQVQLGPATNNKLPVAYGTSWVSPIITDVILSNDQQTMWYVLSFSETTSNVLNDTGTITFGEVYWDDKILIFNPDNPNVIRGWYNPSDNTTITGVAGRIEMYFYNNGSTSPTLHHCVAPDGTGSELPTSLLPKNIISIANGVPEGQEWTDDHKMTNTVFAIVKVAYDGARNISGLGTIKAKIKNDLSAPGSVMMDYLQDTVYGCGISIDNIDEQKFLALNTYSSEPLSIVDTDNFEVSNPFKYQINGYIDTNQNCLTNLALMAANCDSWVQWNELTGQWGVIINQSVEDSNQVPTDLTVVSASQIIGGVNINPTDLKTSANGVKIEFPNAYFRNDDGTFVVDQFRGQSDYRYYILDQEQRSPNEPENEITVQLPLCNNSISATWIGYKRLLASREDLVINFTMDYSGIKIEAGDIICVQHEWYGWTEFASDGTTPKYPSAVGGQFKGRPFRVTQVKEQKSSDGFLSVEIAAVSYNDDLYYFTNPHFFSKVPFSGLTDPNYISQTSQPIIESTTTQFFDVITTAPEQGNVEGIEFWFSNTSTVTANNFALYETQYYTSYSLYPAGATEKCRVYALPAGTYWWKTRGQGKNSYGEFSTISEPFVWEGSATSAVGPIDGGRIIDNSIGGSKVETGDPATQGQPNQSKPSFFDNLAPLAIASLGSLAISQANKRGWFDGIFSPKEDNPETPDDAGDVFATPTIYASYEDENGDPTSTPQEGGYQTIEVAASPQYDEPPSYYASWDDVGGGDYWG